MAAMIIRINSNITPSTNGTQNGASTHTHGHEITPAILRPINMTPINPNTLIPPLELELLVVISEKILETWHGYLNG